MCCELKQRFLHVWHGIDQTIIDNAIACTFPRMCAGKRRTLQATTVTIFSHMTKDVSVFAKCDTIFDCFFEINTNSNFQISQDSAATY